MARRFGLMLAYIDESGDPGTMGRGSRWFVWGCVMVAETDADAVRDLVRSACERAGGGRFRPFHATRFSHDDLHGVIEHCLDPRWSTVIVASDTSAVAERAHIAQARNHAYYAARYVLERVSARAAEVGARTRVYFEQSRTLDQTSFREYVGKASGTGSRMISPDHVSPSDVHVMQKGVDELLCLADLVAYAAYRALEPHRVWHRLERSYLEAIRPTLWRGPGGRESLRTWGFVTMPTAVVDRHGAEYPWLELDDN